MKVLPDDTPTEHQKIIDSVQGKLPAFARMRSHKIEPIAYGLSAIIVDIVTPEEEGVIDKVEQVVAGAPLVGQSEVMGVSRMSGTLPPR